MLTSIEGEAGASAQLATRQFCESPAPASEAVRLPAGRCPCPIQLLLLELLRVVAAQWQLGGCCDKVLRRSLQQFL